jgi:hypothetical protein
MFHTATLVAHRGATLVSRDELARYEPPEPEGRWKPVKHSLIVDLMHQELERREIHIVKEQYAIHHDGNLLFAALTLAWLRDEEMSAAIAFRHSNDKREAMKMYCGMRVFICDNMALSGDEIVMNRRYTNRFSPAAELSEAFDPYQEGALVLQRNIEDMKAGRLADMSAEAMLFQIFHQRILPAHMLVPVADSYYSQSERTGWALLNACTLHAKNLPPSGNMRAHARLGKYFGLGKDNPFTC